MTTTELIKILKEYEHGGATGQSRKISFEIPTFGFLVEPEITVNSIGDGILGAQICLLLSGGRLCKEESEVEDSDNLDSMLENLWNDTESEVENEISDWYFRKTV